RALQLLCIDDRGVLRQDRRRLVSRNDAIERAASVECVYPGGEQRLLRLSFRSSVIGGTARDQFLGVVGDVEKRIEIKLLFPAGNLHLERRQERTRDVL